MTAPIAFDDSHLRAGMRVALAVSGGADSVALLRVMVRCAPDIGVMLSVVHVHHGIRGQAADEDAAFVEALAGRFALPFYLHKVDTPAYAAKHRETLEEAARNQRYAVFGELMEQGLSDAVLTAHTLDDQAETVLMKLLRGAWTEGLSGIHPVLSFPRGKILRPLLGAQRAEIEAWLRELGQSWREDETNADIAFTRNRVRHELLPELNTYNPQIAKTLAQLAELARDEDAYWRQEMNRLLPTLLLPGKAVRGGGRAVTTHPGEGSLGIELGKLRALDPAVRRRALREAARRLGVTLGFEPVERLMAMVATEGAKPAPRREQLTAQLRAERTPRELRLVLEGAVATDAERQGAQTSRLEPVEISVPGESVTAAYGLRIRVSLRGEGELAEASIPKVEPLVLRVPKAGDRVRLRYTSGKKPLKEVFARLHLDSSLRSTWPLIVWRGEVVWMKDVALEPDPTLPFTLDVSSLEEG
jgi:tRNA(Ile)-lysidine synthase